MWGRTEGARGAWGGVLILGIAAAAFSAAGLYVLRVVFREWNEDVVIRLG